MPRQYEVWEDHWQYWIDLVRGEIHEGLHAIGLNIVDDEFDDDTFDCCVEFSTLEDADRCLSLLKPLEADSDAPKPVGPVVVIDDNNPRVLWIPYVMIWSVAKYLSRLVEDEQKAIARPISSEDDE